MAQSIYSKIIAQLRDESGMNQEQIADLLQVSQATVSRIEKGLVPGERLAEKIRKLPIRGISKTEIAKDRMIEVSKEIKNQSFKSFDISYLSLSFSGESGDLCVLKKLTSDTSLVFLTDCVGSGREATDMAFAVRFGLESILSTMNNSIVSNTNINMALNNAIESTHEAWAGPPAMISVILDSKLNALRLTNSLQPLPLFFTNGEVKEIDYFSNSPSTTPEDLLRDSKYGEIIRPMKPGNTLLLCTDGFVELFDDYLQLKEKFMKAAKAFKGDATAILTQVMNGAQGIRNGELNSKFLKDDSTVIIITKEKD